MTQHGYFFLADISGFTAYLVGVELQHAKDILGELLEYIVEQTRPILIFEKFEGDSVFAYAPEEKIARGESVLELIESTYVGFKDRLASMSRRITCTCAACRNVTNLDLKFVVHYGEYLSQQVREHHELLGIAPIFVQRREWKEVVAKSTGWRGYALFSEISLKRLDVHLDEIEGVEFPFAEVKMHGLDLEARYQAMLEARRVIVSPEEADREFELTLPHPPALVWEWLNDPQKRNLWYPSLLKWSAYFRPGGHTTAGAVNHCNHGVGRVIENILDWRPFDYFTVEMRMVPGNIVFLMTIRLEPMSEGKTCIHGCLLVLNPRLLASPMAEMTARFLGSRMQKIDHYPEAMAFVEKVNNGIRIIPTIAFPDGSTLSEPSNAQLAEKLGMQTKATLEYYDSIVVGGGPAGLTAALYMAREGLDVLVIEKSGLGGQVGITQTLDNFPGFHEGISGSEFADRLVL